MTDRRDRRAQYDVADTSKRKVLHASGKLSIIIPRGLGVLRPRKDAPTTISIRPYKCSATHEKFVERLQYAAPGKWYGERTFNVHPRIGVNKDDVTCPAANFRLPCPICEDREVLGDSPNTMDRKRAADLRPRERQMFLADDTDNMTKGLQLWEIAYWNFGRQLDSYTDAAPEKDKKALSRYYDPFEGYTIRLSPMTSKMDNGQDNTVFNIFGMYKREELTDEALNHGYCLDDMVRVMSYKQIEDIYRGVSEGDDETLANRTNRVSVPVGSGNVAPGDGPGDDDDDDDDDNGSANATRPEKTPDPDDAMKFASKDVVSFTMLDNEMQGEITSIDNQRQVAVIAVAGMRKPVTIGLDELTLVRSDDTFDLTNKEDEKGDDEEPPPPKKANAKTESTKELTPAQRAARAAEWEGAEPESTSKTPRKKGSKNK